MGKEKTIQNNRSADFRQNLIICGLLVLSVAAFSILSKNFFSLTNFHSILLTAVPVSLIAIGECVCIMGGYFEMSVGMVASLSGLVCAGVMSATHNAALSVLAGIGLGLLTGLISGLSVSYLRMNAFITTFALQEIYRGIIYLWTGGFAKSLVEDAYSSLTRWGQMRIAGIQMPILFMIIIYILFAVFMHYTVGGRMIFLVGNNAKASRISGINIHRYRLLLFLICDVLAAIAGMLYAMRTASAAPFIGTTYCMEAIAATILGGTSMLGGKGNMLTTFIGVIIIFIIKNGLVMVGLPDFYQYIAIGLILIFAVWIQVEHKKV